MNKKEKQINAIIYILEKYPNIGRTKLMKAIFFMDLIWYNKYKETIFEDNYIRMPNGPVPLTAYKLTDIKKANPYIKIKLQKTTSKHKKYDFFPLIKANMEDFSQEMIDILEKIISFLQKYAATSISEFTHNFRLWSSLEDGEKIPKELFNLDEYEINLLNAKNALKKQKNFQFKHMK
ncbi:Panacea domain-containing protein [Marinitoga lauensis]|uniref:Panacea domain-containing protein n=1 Tax=Marinitoga lauensis TaxID=2201189 RepID=UPI001012BA4D|nr:Panacea domain-containing protein [Marinitoga lauensis]